MVGLDFYGEQTGGGFNSVDMFRDSTHEMEKIVQVQNRMGRDTVLQDKFKNAGLHSLQKEQLRMARTYTATEMTNENMTA